MRTKLSPGPNEPCWCGSQKKYKKCHQGRDLLSAATSAIAAAAPAPTGDLIEPGRIQPRLAVPPQIVAPDYAEGGRPRLVRIPNHKEGAALERMRRACQAAAEILDAVCEAVRPGVTTDDLDRLTHRLCLARGGYPSPLGYHGFPKSVCTSVNEVICHGIPDDRALRSGDIVNIDVTIFLDGMHGDCSRTVPVGTIDQASADLIRVTHECLLRGIAAVRPGGLIRDIGRAIESHATAHGYGVVRAFVGHGVGEAFHMEPQVPHYFDPKATFTMKPGQTFTIEPMINMGTWAHESWADGWTAVTADRRRSAQHEHTLLVTSDGVEVLTLRAGEPQPRIG
jgi:methionyl aminopeptidase